MNTETETFSKEEVHAALLDNARLMTHLLLAMAKHDQPAAHQAMNRAIGDGAQLQVAINVGSGTTALILHNGKTALTVATIDAEGATTLQ
ncbi:MAG: hypothetical protein KDI74_04745 [Gammaproteobacteria bacterium]|nr:hypothetical protein [Gammaproteobacteria bacterium]